jgi:hypothetical protein
MSLFNIETLIFAAYAIGKVIPPLIQRVFGGRI